MWAHDPRVAQDWSTSSEKCTHAIGNVFLKVPIFSQTECQANAEENGFDYNEGTTCAGGNKKGSCYVSSFFKRYQGFTNTPKGDSGGALTVEDGVLAGLVSRGGSEDCGTVSKDLKKFVCFFRNLDFHSDARCRRVYLTYTLMLLPTWSGSMTQSWVWEACSRVDTLWRKYFQRTKMVTRLLIMVMMVMMTTIVLIIVVTMMTIKVMLMLTKQILSRHIPAISAPWWQNMQRQLR